jgi:predicted GNAT superfamily acetyltransferase
VEHSFVAMSTVKPVTPTLETLHGVSLAEQASAAAEAAAARAGLDIIELADVDRILRASELFNVVWAAGPDDPLMPANLLRAMTHAGNYAFAAYDGSEMVGAIMAFFGRLDGELQLHSHILGVSPRSQNRHIGYALKQHQRAWALRQGITVVTWTFDPLVRRNAYFNLAKLGATVRAFYPNFYGAMNDGINGGDESDRVLAQWSLDAPNVVAASVGEAWEADLRELRDAGAVLLLEENEDGEPVATDRRGPVLLAAIPEDIVAVRLRDRALANRWRAGFRDVFTRALGDGYVAAGMTKSGWYVLRPAPEA